MTPHVRHARSGLLSRAWWLLVLAVLPLLSLSLAWVSNRFHSLQGWESFLWVTILGVAILLAGWLGLRRESAPRWVAGLIVGAALLRLAAGVSWYLALPVYGYNSPAELAGYIHADAYQRDQAAWELAQSGKPLVKAFQGYRKADQYGGLLYLSAGVYRLFGGQSHASLLMVLITASFSALAVGYTWAFSRRAWGQKTALVAAAALALYPEAILVGGSQMREAFSITLTVMAFYGLIRFVQDRSWVGVLWVLGAILVSLPFSPPSAAVLMLAVGLQAVFMRPWQGSLLDRRGGQRQRWLWLVWVVLGALILVGVWLAWRQYAPEGVTGPIALVGWWVRKSAEMQAHLSRQASGWVQKVYKGTPDWLHTPLLLVYGAARPFLPAAISDVTGALIWRTIAVWRALGWILLLPLLAYASLRALVSRGAWFERGLSLVVWLSVLAASLRGGADLWDNPRYRAMFAGLQVALAAWVWVDRRRARDPWLRRALVGGLVIVAWFLPWFLRRYIHIPWPVVDPFKTLALGVLSAFLYWIWDWAGGGSTENRL